MSEKQSTINNQQVTANYIRWIRERVGRRKIFLVFGGIALFDGHGRLLLQRRADFDVWGLSGGALELSEDIESCARRELLEETGLTAGPLRLVGVYTDPHYDHAYPNGDEVQQFSFCFAGQVNGGELQADGVESHDVRFFAPEEMAGLNIPHWYRDKIRDALAGGPPTFRAPFVNGRPQDQIAAVRQHIGHDTYIGVGATAVIMRDDGRLLMTKRADNGAWVFPAGYCDLGENAAHTAVREVREETGYEIALERIIAVYSAPHFHHTYPNGDRVKNVGVTFRARLAGGTAVRQEDEIAEMAWLTADEARERVGKYYGRLALPLLDCLDDGYVII